MWLSPIVTGGSVILHGHAWHEKHQLLQYVGEYMSTGVDKCSFFIHSGLYLFQTKPAREWILSTPQQQATINYKDISNRHCLLHHGFRCQNIDRWALTRRQGDPECFSSASKGVCSIARNGDLGRVRDANTAAAWICSLENGKFLLHSNSSIILRHINSNPAPFILASEKFQIQSNWFVESAHWNGPFLCSPTTAQLLPRLEAK